MYQEFFEGEREEGEEFERNSSRERKKIEGERERKRREKRMERRNVRVFFQINEHSLVPFVCSRD